MPFSLRCSVLRRRATVIIIVAGRRPQCPICDTGVPAPAEGARAEHTAEIVTHGS